MLLFINMLKGECTVLLSYNNSQVSVRTLNYKRFLFIQAIKVSLYSVVFSVRDRGKMQKDKSP